ncbi:MAG: tryptophan-rich sensory protein [Clostridia bacterium]|nr:tryptophan-rich sensory protein [Clostridia bacterium]
MKPINLKRLIIAVLIPLAVGGLSALLSGNISGKYTDFAQPPLSPPAIIFPIVWTILYTIMGIASYLVYEDPTSNRAKKEDALLYYGLQLFANFLWSIIFFRFDAYWFAFTVIIVLIALVIITMLKFRKINKTAFYLLIPYLIWLLFATYLNIGVAVLN